MWNRFYIICLATSLLYAPIHAFQPALIQNEEFIISDTIFTLVKLQGLKYSPCAMVTDGIVFQNRNGKINLFDTSKKNVRELCGKNRDFISRPYTLRNFGDTSLAVITSRDNKIEIYDIKNGKTKTILQVPKANFSIWNISFLDSLLLLCGQARVLEYKLPDSINCASANLYAIMYFGSDVSKLGQILQLGYPIKYNEIVSMNHGIGDFTNDVRILILDSWLGKLREFDIDGRFLYEYAPAEQLDKCPEDITSFEQANDALFSCSNYNFAFIIHPFFIAQRNMTNPPVYLDLWNIETRKFAGSISIGNSFVIGHRKSGEIWTLEFDDEDHAHIKGHTIEPAFHTDSLENIAQIRILEPLKQSYKSLVCYLPANCKDTVAIINSSIGDCSLDMLMFKLSNRFSILRIMTDSISIALLTYKNAFSYFDVGDMIHIYNLNIELLELSSVILCLRDGSIIKKLDSHEVPKILLGH